MTDTSKDYSNSSPRRILLLRPRGFCAGVVRAIDIVNLALEYCGAPIYVRKEIVHNTRVVADLQAKGAVFVDSVEEVPSGALVIYSAHGVSPEVREQAAARNLRVIDATCPLVTKVHLEAMRFAKQGFTIILIGHKDHDEVIGTLGEAPSRTILVSSEADVANLDIADPDRVAYLTQTTLSLDEASGIIAALERRFPKIEGPPAQDICYATENRQVAVKAVAPRADLLLVVGSPNSSNSNRLVEVAGNMNMPGHLIEDQNEIRPEWLIECETVAVTAGASAPEYLVQQVIQHLRQLGYSKLDELEIVPEDVRFALPQELIALAPASTRA
ncbi:MAG TPA: 4-hydroxy-3-methylbut-2-enyl diphosphate reductase [Candidatus Saccharimonadales bacterium]|nr:4-hydroxy-3-methylbut-2-enyl diphosphate reductase [Candidatus Saccharimonadales bacterium]